MLFFAYAMPLNKDENKKFDNTPSGYDNNVPEDVEIVEEEEEKNPRDTIKKLREALKASQKERQEYLEGWQRMKADAVNARRQEEEWRSEFVKFAEEKLVLRLLPVLESFNLATGNKGAWEALPKDWRLGMEHIYRELVTALSEHGLSEISPNPGDPFDPKFQTSVGTVVALDKELDHTVAEVVQKGYSLNDKVLKPARVSIAEFSVKEK